MSKQAKLTKQQESAKENLCNGQEEEKQESPQGKSCLDDRKQVESQRKPDGIVQKSPQNPPCLGGKTVVTPRVSMNDYNEADEQIDDSRKKNVECASFSPDLSDI